VIVGQGGCLLRLFAFRPSTAGAERVARLTSRGSASRALAEPCARLRPRVTPDALRREADAAATCHLKAPKHTPFLQRSGQHITRAAASGLAAEPPSWRRLDAAHSSMRKKPRQYVAPSMVTSARYMPAGSADVSGHAVETDCCGLRSSRCNVAQLRHRVSARLQAATRPFSHVVHVHPTVFRPAIAEDSDKRLAFQAAALHWCSPSGTSISIGWNGDLVLRFLAEDLAKDLDTVLDVVPRALANGAADEDKCS
jgi:hypothetical protein